MSDNLQVFITFVVFISLLTAGMTVPFAITIPALLYLLMQGGLPALNSLGLVSWGSMNSFALTAVPLFMLMAEILFVSGLSTKIYRGLARLVAPLPGGLLQTNIAGCAVFSSVSGSSIATAGAIGSVALPELLKRGYSRRISAGSLAAGGTLGILLPPSFPLIIYGAFTQTSVPQLFIAGVFPGLLMTAAFMAYNGYYALKHPEGVPKETAEGSGISILQAFLDILPFFFLILGTLGMLYAGIVTTSEAAAVGCFMAIVIGVVWGDLNWRSVGLALRNTILLTGNILFLILAAYIFSVAISFAGVGEAITGWVVSLGLNKWEFFFALLVLFTVLGCLVESLGMIVITVPLLFPMLSSYGIDPILFGIVLVIFVELGQISPPIGINLFVIQSLWKGKLIDVVFGTIPFHLIMLFVLLIVILFPEIATWLPAQMRN